ncbi:hypothetical protein chiPu_0008467 [Chiloscyllium punctatum]|uniref:Uncharacterized protein n=1 Tax=Chiloscyllium punctatum TaxID=137246 RepID=A0A401SI48_CHIPU|nr:hypothetical protein [Chiloscyllium punctatum]
MVNKQTDGAFRQADARLDSCVSHSLSSRVQLRACAPLLPPCHPFRFDPIRSSRALFRSAPAPHLNSTPPASSSTLLCGEVRNAGAEPDVQSAVRLRRAAPHTGARPVLRRVPPTQDCLGLTNGKPRDHWAVPMINICGGDG